MLSLKFHALMIWLHNMESWVPAVLVTAGLALLIVCAVSCTSSPCEEKDDMFHRRSLLTGKYSPTVTNHSSSLFTQTSSPFLL